MPARRLLLKICNRIEYDLSDVAQVCKVWEDNYGTENLANSKGPLMMPRTKHIGIKYNWFRSRINPNKIEIIRISTNQKKADIFSKGLTKSNFEQIRKLVLE